MIIKLYKIGAVIVFLLCIYYLWEVETTDQNTVIHNGEVMERGIAYHDPKAYKLHSEALNFLENNNITQAKATLFQLLSDYPDYTNGYIVLGKIQVDQNKLKKAKQTFLMAIKVKPDHHQPYARLAYVEAKLGNCEEAIKQYTKAIDIEDNYARAHYGIASCSYRLNKLDIAEIHAKKTIALKNDKIYVEAAEKLLERIGSVGQSN
jgi:tetratricopeptide (TPR) repeat protein